MNRRAMVFIAMGFEAVAAVLAGVWLGGYFDKNLGGKGYGPVLGALLFLIGWVIHLLVMAKKFESESEDSSQ